MLVLFVGWSIYFVYRVDALQRREKPQGEPRRRAEPPSTYVEVGVVIAEAVLLLGFSIPLWAERVNHFPAENEAVVVHVIGQQFAWNIHYPGPDGKFGKTDPKLVDATIEPDRPRPQRSGRRKTTSSPSTSCICRSASRRSFTSRAST